MNDFILLTFGLWLLIVVVVLVMLHFADPSWIRTKGDIPRVAVGGLGFAALIAGFGFFVTHLFQVIGVFS
jgi:hypothetical protein